jgi:gamma-glutamyltranspeptidase/glutathione hydrolase
MGPRHAIAAGHHLAAAAGMAVLEGGGNATDAGCAAGLALGVLLPDLVNVAGVAPILIRRADGTCESIAGLGPWPVALPPDIFLREHGGTIPDGVRRSVVPAAPDAWITALERDGTLGFADIASFAIRYAEEGFAVFPLLRESILAHRADYARWESNAAIFLPGGSVPEVGERFVQRDLARTLRFLADEARAGEARGGRLAGLAAARRAFYEGEIAEAIVRFQRDEGGFLSRADLAAFRSPIEQVVRRPWRGQEVITCGAWCQGPALLLALGIAERAGIAAYPRNSADQLHILAESIKAAMADREHHFGDPRFVDVPLDALLGEAHLAARAAGIDPGRAEAGLKPAILPAGAHPIALARRPVPLVEADTSHVSVVDRWGNAFSATPSDGSWNSPVVPGLGIIPSNRGSQSRPDPRHPAGVAPGKRPRLTPNPVIVVTEDGGVMPIGTPGGDVQIQAVMQVLLNVFVHGMGLQEAVEAPRVATHAFPSSFAPFEMFPARLSVEAGIAPEVRRELEARGHVLQDWPERCWLAGAVEVAMSRPKQGLVAAAADPRRPTAAIAA